MLPLTDAGIYSTTVSACAVTNSQQLATLRFFATVRQTQSELEQGRCRRHGRLDRHSRFVSEFVFAAGLQVFYLQTARQKYCFSPQR
jgi:hypothetical protein